jgi:hypothetical protein
LKLTFLENLTRDVNKDHENVKAIQEQSILTILFSETHPLDLAINDLVNRNVDVAFCTLSDQFSPVVRQMWSLGMKDKIIELVQGIFRRTDFLAIDATQFSPMGIILDLFHLVETFKDKEIIASFDSLILELLRCIRRIIQASMPLEPVRWARDMITPCCTHCHTLNNFLVNPDRKIMEFKHPEVLRKHIQRQLLPCDFDFETRRVSPVPYALIITKRPVGKYHRDKASWNASIDAHRQRLVPLQIDRMKSVLGDEFEDLLWIDKSARLLSVLPSKRKAQN